jgi:hypothetical protein
MGKPGVAALYGQIRRVGQRMFPAERTEIGPEIPVSCRELLELSGFVAHQLSASVVSVVGLVGLVGNALALSTNPQGLKVATSKQITRRPSAHR